MKMLRIEKLGKTWMSEKMIRDVKAGQRNLFVIVATKEAMPYGECTGMIYRTKEHVGSEVRLWKNKGYRGLVLQVVDSFEPEPGTHLMPCPVCGRTDHAMVAHFG